MKSKNYQRKINDILTPIRKILIYTRIKNKKAALQNRKQKFVLLSATDVANQDTLVKIALWTRFKDADTV